MNPFDVIMIVALGVVVIFSLIKGIINVAVSLLSLIVGTWVALRFYPVTAGYLNVLTESQMWANIIGFFIIFFLITLSISIGGFVLKNILKISKLGWIDRVGGAMFGFVMGCLIIYLTTIILVTFASPQTPFLKTSKLAPHVIKISTYVADFIPSDFKKQFEEKGSDLLKIWQEKIIDMEERDASASEQEEDDHS